MTTTGTGRRVRTGSVTAGAALAGSLAVLCLGAGSAGATVVLPPELQALEQKAATLKITSERFSLTETVLASLEGEETVSIAGRSLLSPPEGEVSETIKGKHVVVRIVGHWAYLAYPGLARIDGNRPWVRTSVTALEKEGGVNPAAAPTSPAAGYQLLNSATESIKEIGPAVVAGQPTVEFSARVNIAGLISSFGPELVHALEAKDITTAGYTLYIAADGLPVKVEDSIEASGDQIVTTFMVLETNEPVTVRAPSRRRYISLAEFERVERRHAKK